MKIEKINLYVLDLPVADLEEGYIYGGDKFYKQDAVIAEVVTENGLVGWGEHTAIGGTYVAFCWKTTLAALEYMAPVLIGQDPCTVSVINSVMDKTFKGHRYAKAAIDYACWDILGKTCDLQVYQLLGGRQMDSAPMYMVVQAFPDPAQTKHFYEEMRGLGYTHFQIKVGDKVQKALERVKAICPLIDPDKEHVFADGNTQWSKKQALQFLRQLQEYEFVFEQPCLSYEDCLGIKHCIDRPMKLDESLSQDSFLLRALADKAMEVACLKISYFGGITGGKLARDMCMANGVRCHIEDTWGTEITTSAYAHLAVATPEEWLYCTTDLHNYNSLLITEPGTGPIVENGRLRPSELPGLGVSPDRKILGDPVAIFK
jgi:L-alanine-DL-glutamate epimerase-like enolase superfamily enzyme